MMIHQMPEHLPNILHHVPIMAAVIDKSRESLGDKFTKFIVNGGFGVLLIAIFGWAFSVESRVSKNTERLVSIEQDINELQKYTSESAQRSREMQKTLQSIDDYLTNKYPE